MPNSHNSVRGRIGRALIRLGCWMSGLQQIAYFPERFPTSCGSEVDSWIFVFREYR